MLMARALSGTATSALSEPMAWVSAGSLRSSRGSDASDMGVTQGIGASRWLVVRASMVVVQRGVWSPMVVLASVSLLATSLVACGNGEGSSSQCEVGGWTSRSMVVPPQAAIGDIAQTGGGDGIAISFDADHRFLMDFGPMRPATASFSTAGQEGTLTVGFRGVGEGTWSADAKGAVTGTFASFETASASAMLTLGVTQPPIFNLTLQQLNDQMMIGGQKIGVFTVSSCKNNHMTLSTPFPSGTLSIEAVRNT
jgi:hypothetical protein